MLPVAAAGAGPEGCWRVFGGVCADCGGFGADWLLEVPGTAMLLKSIRGRPREEEERKRRKK